MLKIYSASILQDISGDGMHSNSNTIKMENQGSSASAATPYYCNSYSAVPPSIERVSGSSMIVSSGGAGGGGYGGYQFVQF